jgi:hypothetical protein
MTGPALRTVGSSSPQWPPAWLRQLAGDTRGQDLVEYALLTAGVGLAAAATWTAVQQAFASAYAGYDTKVQNLWEPPNPGAAP